MTHTNANRRNLALLNPNPGQSFARVPFNSELRQKFDQQAFNPTQIFVQILAAMAQVDNRIAHQLSRPMIRCLATPIDPKKWMRQMRSTAQTALVRRPSNGVNRLMLQ